MAAAETETPKEERSKGTDLAKLRFPSGGSALDALRSLLHRYPDFESLEGWLHVLEGALLHDLAGLVSPENVIVEVGSYRGKSTTAMALGTKPGTRLYAFDPHEMHVGSNGGVYGPKDLIAFNETMKKANTQGTVFPMSCGTDLVAEAWKKPVGLAFIDGDHRYEGCRVDADGWMGHVVKGGYIAFDDVNLEGPKKVMEEVVALTNWAHVITIGKVGVVKKTATLEEIIVSTS